MGGFFSSAPQAEPKQSTSSSDEDEDVQSQQSVKQAAGDDPAKARLVELAKLSATDPKATWKEPDVLDVFVTNAAKGKPLKTRLKALKGLANLCSAPEIARSICKLHEKAMNEMLNALEDAHPDVFREGLRAVHGLSSDFEVARFLVKEWDLLELLQRMEEQADPMVCAIYLNLTVVPTEWSAISKSGGKRFERIAMGGSDSPVTTIARVLTIAVIESPKLSEEDSDLKILKDILKLLEAALHGRPYQSLHWPLLQVLAGIQALTSDHSNRLLFGTKWLNTLYKPIRESVEITDDAIVAAKALGCLENYGAALTDLSDTEKDSFIELLKNLVIKKSILPLWTNPRARAENVIGLLQSLRHKLEKSHKRPRMSNDDKDQDKMEDLRLLCN